MRQDRRGGQHHDGHQHQRNRNRGKEGKFDRMPPFLCHRTRMSGRLGQIGKAYRPEHRHGQHMRRR